MIIINNQLKLFWKIGKFVYDKRFSCENIINKCSLYFAYYFGNSSLFSHENIIFMKKFYLYFPIYLERMNDLNWESYLELIKINDKKVCYFYYNLALFFGYRDLDIKEMIKNDIYFRI